MRGTVVVVTGATASGKTRLAIELAEALRTEIVSADSRQVYRGLPIVTAQPTAEELRRVRHHFVGFLGLEEYYSAARFEEDALRVIGDLLRRYGTAVVVGGSMLYLDALCRGLDRLPEVSEGVRRRVRELYESSGIEGVMALLELLDPDYARRVDARNARRVIHAVEVSLEAGRGYSTLLTGGVVERPFRMVQVAIGRSREELYERINRRVDEMMAMGLEEEARGVYGQRGLNSLNTVGLKEMFAYFDGRMSREEAIGRIGKNTRVYAKKQLLWVRSRPEIRVVDAGAEMVDEVLGMV